MNNALALLLRTGVSAAAFYLIYRMVDTAALKRVVLDAHWGWLCAAAGFYIAVIAAAVVRWRLLRPASARVGWGFFTESMIVAGFFNAFLPTTVGGDGMRAFDLKRVCGSWIEAASCIVVDRLLGLSGLLLVAVFSFAAFKGAHGDPVLWIGFFAVCGAAGIAWSMLLWERGLKALLSPFERVGRGDFSATAAELSAVVRGYRSRRFALTAAISLSALIQVMLAATFWAMARGMHLDTTALAFFVTVPIIMVVSQVPISLGGWGWREGAAVVLLGRAGVSPEGALSMSLLFGSLGLLWGAAGGVLFLLRSFRSGGSSG